MAIGLLSLVTIFMVSLTWTSTYGSEIKCIRVTLKSTEVKPVNKVIVDENKVPQEIVKVEVWDQISELKCVEWFNFFHYSTYIIAKGGCQATFKVCYKKTVVTTTSAPLTTIQTGCTKIRLLSRKARPVSKEVEAPVTSMRLLQNLNEKVQCEEGVNFRFQGSTVVAELGCRGDFEVCTSPAELTTPASPFKCKKVVVKSTRKKPAQQRVTDSRGQPAEVESVSILREISTSVKCKEWVNYFVFGSFVITKQGCQACFKVCYKEAPTTPGAITTESPDTCKHVKALRPTRKFIRDDNNRPARITSVELVREISHNVCSEGVNYSFRGSLFAVRRGCKGLFRVCYEVVTTTPAPLTTPEPEKPVCKKITSKSKALLPGRVDVTDDNGNPVHIIHVHVWDQISKIKCVEWANYFYSDSYIITKNGCHATFKVCYKVKKQTTTPAPLTTTPEPEICKRFHILKPTTATVTGSNGQPATITSLTLVREISKYVCQEGVNYFFQGSEFVVRGGCKGIFKVCYTEVVTTPAPITTTEEPELVCDKVTAKSKGQQSTRVDVTDAHGNPVHIVHVHVWDQISEKKCVEWFNFFFFESYIIAQKGCHATFKVCYIVKKPTTTPAPLTTTPEPEICKKYQILKPTTVTVSGSNGQPATITSVTLVREISKHVCQEGVNYFFQGSEFVVRGGCKGIFRVCYTEVVTTPAPITTTEEPEIVCEKIDVKSKGANPDRVDVTDSHGNPVHIVHVHVWDQISEIKCVEWVNYFYSESYIVAKKGCRATFKVCYKVKKPTTTPAPLTTTPEPEICKKYQILKPTTVSVRGSNGQPATITSVTLIREISKYVCQEGVNYFFQGSEFVVRGGCKGVFRVCYTEVVTTPAPITTTEEPEIVCEKIDVKSKGASPGRVDVTDSHGNPVHIVHVHVWDQISEIKCVEWVNYFYSESYIVAKKGCRATFKVCYKVKKPTTTPAPLTTTPEPEICKKYQILKPTTVSVRGSNGQPATITSVTLVREISKYVCQEGVNYFFQGSEFVVRGGCKGIFKVCYTEVVTTPAPITTTEEPEIVCEKIDVKSKGASPGRVDVTDSHGNPVHIIHVHVWDQISEIKCVEWVNYFYSESYIVAKKGCRATFKVCYKVKKPTTTPAPLTTTPEPEICKKYQILKPTTVTVRGSNGQSATITSVTLVREISKYVCQEGVNYFFQGSEFVVRGGCKGIFKVCYTEVVTTPAPITTTEEPELVCEKIDVKSKGANPGRVDVTDSNGNPVHIVHVHVWDQISEIKCVEWVNYFYSESYIVAKKGCRATFKVCYKVKKPTTTPAPLTTTPEPEICKKYQILKPTTVSVRGSNGQPATITSLTLVREISKYVCQEGVNYFFQGSEFVVRGGCKGIFRVCYTEVVTTPAPITTTEEPEIVCEKIDVKSKGANPGRVDVTDSNGNPVHIVHVHVWDQISEIKCVEWVNYFYSESYIVAKKGCRATFKVCYKVKKPTTTPAPLTTTPEPEICKKYQILKPTTVTIRGSNGQPATITSLILVREISKHVCQEGVDYFFQGSEFVVRGGCKGIFRVCYTEVVTTPAPITTTEEPEIVCKKIDVKSKGASPGRVDVTDSHGNPVHIVHVHVWDQISEIKCVEWVNYFYSESYIVAKKGCRATFKVCYKVKKPTTTPAPLTTTPEPEICKKYQILKPTTVTVRDSNGQPASITSLTLVREISKHVCQEGVKYFFQGSEFVVRGGCKGVFRVCYTEVVTTPAPITTTEEPEIVCEKIDVKSKGANPGRVDVTDSHGNPVHIVHVHVWDQISEIKCVEWINYFYSESYIVAKKGCRATFKVCYKVKKPTTTPAPLTTTPEPEICKKYQILKPTTVSVRGSNGQPATITSVTLVREISKHVCQEGVNYFFQGSEFVVRGGCKGIFRVCYTEVVTTPAPITTTEEPEIVCEKIDVKSKGANPGRVDVTDSHGNPVHIVHVHVWDQISEIKCVEWVNYFYSESYIVAKKGCRATFKVCYKVTKPTTTPAPLTTTPEPEICKKYQILKPTTVSVRGSNGQPATITSLTLVREISKHVCQEGVNYFFQGSEFVVRGGCKGVFRVCYTEVVTTPAPITTTEEPEMVCEKIDVKSKGANPGRVDVTDSHGNPVHIVHVHVWDQISEIKCVEWVNYFYSESYIVAKKGCRATFKVCYKVTKPTTTPAPLTTTPEPEICKKYQILKPTTVSVRGSNGQPATITSLTLVREISKHVCQEGVNYFFQGSEFVVRGGCKGVFRVCYTEVVTTPAPITTTEEPEIVCEKIDVKSNGANPGRVDVTDSNGNPVHIVHVHVWDQISEIKCVEWVNYFYSESYIVAKKGCRATFKVCYKVTKPTTTPAPLTTTPEPEICKKYQILKPTTVTVRGSNGQPATITSLLLVREISKYVCQEGANYFFQGSEFVVRGGCKGIFRVCYTEVVTTPAPITTTEEPEIVCEKIDVKSKGANPGRVDVTDSHGNPVHIVHVHVWDQISEIKCVEWVNYFYSESYIVAKKGCRATFKVCYKVKKPTTTPAPLTTTPEPEICKKYQILKPTTISVRGSNGQPATITSLTLVREISKHVCQEGVNYFFQGSEFVVRGGCKGIFRVCYTEVVTTPAPITTTEEPEIVCEKIDVKSKGANPGRVDVTDSHGNPVHIIHVHVWDQISEIKCVEWINYFYSESYIVAKKGCRATFKVCYKVKKPTTTPAPLTTTPEPEICKKYQILKPTTVSVRGSNGQPATITSLTLVREISKHVCQEGVNYFFQGSEFVVRGGCKGVFRVCYTEVVTTPAPITTTEEPEIVCKKIDVKSKGATPGRVDVKDDRGNPVHIVHVHVWDQISKIKCVEWLTYFYSESYIVAKKGCRATFKVCYKVKKPTTTPAPLTTTPEPEICKKYQILKPTTVSVRGSNGQPATITSLTLVREISKHVCQEGVNYFFQGSEFVVRGGCKGIFRVCYTEVVTTPAPITTTEEQPVCEKIDVKSKGGKQGRVDVTDSNGNPVHIVHVHVWDQISEIKCVEWVNYFYSESYIVAKHGCHATFKVCYKSIKPEPTTAAPLTTTPEPKSMCKTVVLKASALDTDSRTISSPGRGPVTITNINLIKEVSRGVCVEWYTFFAAGNTVFAKHGCKGVFHVCYEWA